MSTPYAKASVASQSREEGVTKPMECKQAPCPVHSEKTERLSTVKIHCLSAVTVSAFFLLLQYHPSFCCYSLLLLSAVTVSPFFLLLLYHLLSAVTVSPFFLLLQYHPSFNCYSITLLSAFTVSPFFQLLQYLPSFYC